MKPAALRAPAPSWVTWLLGAGVLVLVFGFASLAREVRDLRAELAEQTRWLSSGDLTTGWVSGSSIHTVRTPRDPSWSVEKLLQEHLAQVLPIRRADEARPPEPTDR